jgi:hypothetical protein
MKKVKLLISIWVIILVLTTTFFYKKVAIMPKIVELSSKHILLTLLFTILVMVGVWAFNLLASGVASWKNYVIDIFASERSNHLVFYCILCLCILTLQSLGIAFFNIYVGKSQSSDVLPMVVIMTIIQIVGGTIGIINFKKE